MSHHFISVIVPVFEDPAGIEETLQTLVAQEYPRTHYEVLVVDNGSADRTPEVVSAVVSQHSELVTLLTEKEVQSSYAARNRGIARARGELLCFIDADISVPPDYLTGVNTRFVETDVEFLGCEIEVYTTAEDETLSARYNALHDLTAEKYFQQFGFIPTACLTVQRIVIDRIGMFESRLESGGDTEYSLRAAQAGVKKDFAPELVLRHPARSKYSSLLKKWARLGRGFAQMQHFFGDQYDRRFQVTFSVRDHLAPSNPLRIYHDLKRRNFPAAPLSVGLLSLYKLPLNWMSLFAYCKEMRRLNEGT